MRPVLCNMKKTRNGLFLMFTRTVLLIALMHNWFVGNTIKISIFKNIPSNLSKLSWKKRFNSIYSRIFWKNSHEKRHNNVLNKFFINTKLLAHRNPRNNKVNCEVNGCSNDSKIQKQKELYTETRWEPKQQQQLVKPYASKYT